MQPISRYEIREELRRVLQSRAFAKARKKSRFLEFVCEQALLGNGATLSEYLIGVEVYERGPDFNTQADAIVRVQACEIRRALKEYYAGEGRENAWRIDLPAGHYVPVFVRAPVPEAASPSTPEPEEAALPSTAGLDAAAIPAAPSFFRRRGLALALVVVTAALVLSTALWLGQRSPRTAAQVRGSAGLTESAEWFWRPFLAPSEPPLIVLPNHPLLRAAHEGDTPATMKRAHRIGKEDIPEFRDTMHFRELRGFFFVPDLTDFTGIGEAVGLLTLFEFFSSAGQKVRVKQARLLDFEALKHGNTILLGGNQAWSGRILLYQEGFWFHAGVITNKAPHRGEMAVYKPEFDPVTNSLRRDYALILMLPNENPEQRIVLIYGIYTQGTQAAMEYVTRPERLRELRNGLLASSADGKTLPKYFQALITATVENDVPGRVSFVAARAIPE